MSQKILSLSRARKSRDKAGKQAQADTNAVKFGQSKAQKHLSKTQAEKTARALDSHKRDQ